MSDGVDPGSVLTPGGLGLRRRGRVPARRRWSRLDLPGGRLLGGSRRIAGRGGVGGSMHAAAGDGPSRSARSAYWPYFSLSMARMVAASSGRPPRAASSARES